MDKTSILQMMLPKVKPLSLGDETIFLSQWLLVEADNIIKAQKEFSEDAITANEFFAVVAINSACDESGKRIFEVSDMDALSQSSAVTLKAIYREAMEMNSVKMEEDAEKN